MPLVTAKNSCYYNCDPVMETGKQEEGEYKKMDDIKRHMEAQIHGDFESRRKADLTSAQKAISKKEEEIKNIKKLTPIIEGLKDVMTENKTKPKPGPENKSMTAAENKSMTAAEKKPTTVAEKKPMRAAAAVEGGSIEENPEKEKNNIMKDIMKNNSKSIIQKIMSKEKNKNRKLGVIKNKPIKGGGIKEI